MTTTTRNPPARPLPITIVPGMPVTPLEEDAAAVVGVTQASCVYRLAGGRLAVAPWHELAVGNVCPAGQLLPADVQENDRRNWSARVLRELLGLEAFGWSDLQRRAYEELVEELCGK